MPIDKLAHRARNIALVVASPDADFKLRMGVFHKIP